MTWPGAALTCELADVLARHGGLCCQPAVDDADGRLTLTVSWPATTTEEALQVLELLQALRYLADVSQLRGIASRYDIAPERLEALLPKEGDNG